MFPIIKINYKCSRVNNDVLQDFMYFILMCLFTQISTANTDINPQHILIEHIYCLEDIYRILLYSSPDIYLLTGCYTAD